MQIASPGIVEIADTVLALWPDRVGHTAYDGTQVGLMSKTPEICEIRT
jgi:hypothetical protein